MRLHTPTDRITTTARALPPRTQTAARPTSPAEGRQPPAERPPGQRRSRPLTDFEPQAEPAALVRQRGSRQLRDHRDHGDSAGRSDQATTSPPTASRCVIIPAAGKPERGNYGHPIAASTATARAVGIFQTHVMARDHPFDDQ